MLMAMVDGIKNRIEPGKPMDKNIYELEEKELARIPKVPGSLAESIDALEKDHKFLLEGKVFEETLIDSWIQWKRKNELSPIALRPHPYEFALYYDC